MIGLNVGKPKDETVFDAVEWWREMQPSAKPLMEVVADSVVARVRRKLGGSGGGRVYTRSGQTPPVARQQQRASAPGQPPAEFTGRLARSIGRKPVKSLKWKTKVSTGTDVPYAVRLEWGGRGGANNYIAPRPFFRPAFKESERDIDRILERLP